MVGKIGGPNGSLAEFLKKFGPFLLTYQPKAIVVFSAHWDTHDKIESKKSINITDFIT